MTCPALVHQTVFCLFLFMELIKVVRVSLCLVLALGACPRGKYILLGDRRKGPVLPGCPLKPAFLEHSWERRDQMTQRRPARFPGSLGPLLPDQLEAA